MGLLDDVDDMKLTPEKQKSYDKNATLKGIIKAQKDKIIALQEELEGSETKVEVIREIPRSESTAIIPATQQEIESFEHFPTKEELSFMIERYKFVKKELIDESDIQQQGNRQYIKKSGWRKFINAFGLTVETLHIKITESDDDVIAEAKVRVSTPKGQSVEAYGWKQKSEYYSKKRDDYGGYNIHNLKATARTRAVNIAVSDLVGYGEVSAEEIEGSNKESIF